MYHAPMTAREDSHAVTALDGLFQMAARLDKIMKARLDERGLTAARAEVILVLQVSGEIMQRRLSRTLRCTPRNVTALVDVLERQGWVRRRPDPNDRRATLVSLTEQGEKAASSLAAERREAASCLLEDISEAEMASFVAVAERVLARMDSTLPPGKPPRQRK